MIRWIGLLRGVNVGGNNRLPMAELRNELEQLGMKNVRTYIQSGNLVFDSAVKKSAVLAQRIAGEIQAHHGFTPDVMLLQREELIQAVRNNPFPKATIDPKTLHFFFLASTANSPDLEAMEKSKTATESYKLIDRVFYLHTPDGLARSKLAAKVEKLLGTRATARNYQTVDQLIQLALQA